MSFWTRDRKQRTEISLKASRLFAPLAVAGILLAVALLMVAYRTRSGGLLGAMYRTEANLVAVESAVRAYKDQYASLPPSGKEGLQLAIDEQNRHVTFYPGEALKDAWDRNYVYVKSDDYASESFLAIKDARSGLYHNRGGYQLYSLGADGEQSREDGLMAGDRLNDDNINNWDSNAKWRSVYRRRAKRIPGAREE